MVFDIPRGLLKEEHLNNALLLLCIILLAFTLANIDSFLFIFIIHMLILLLVFILSVSFGREARRYCLIVSFPSVLVTLFLLDLRNQFLEYMQFAILLIILAFFSISSLRISKSSLETSSRIFYVISPISPLMVFLLRNGLSSLIFEKVFLIILGIIFLVSFFLYYYEISFFVRRIRRRFAPFESKMIYLNNDLNILDIGEILSFFLFQIALIQYLFDLEFIVATVFCLYVLFAVNNYLRFEIGFDFYPLIQHLSVIFTILIAGLIIYYWLNIESFSVFCPIILLSVLFLLTSFSAFLYRIGRTRDWDLFGRLSDLNYLFVPIFLSIIIYDFEYVYPLEYCNFLNPVDISEGILCSLYQSTMTSLITIAGMGLATYITVVFLLIRKSKKIHQNSGHRALFAISIIILSFLLRCFKLLNFATEKFMDARPTEIFYIACQTNHTLIILMITALSIIFLVYKDQKNV